MNQKNQKQPNNKWCFLRIAGTDVKASVAITKHHDMKQPDRVTDATDLPFLAVGENRQWAFLGPQKTSEFVTNEGKTHYFTQVELTIVVPRKKRNIRLLTKSFYEARGGRSGRDVKETKGHFEFVRGTPDGNYMVYRRNFPITHSGATVHSKIETDENKNNLYVAFLKDNGEFVIVAVAVIIDPKKGAYLVYEQVYQADSFKTDTGPICPLLEHGVNGRYRATVLWEVLRNAHYRHRYDTLLEKPEGYTPKPARALGRLKKRGEGDKAVYEIFVDMISPARRMSMGLDQTGRHIYINWDALEVRNDNELRHVPLHTIIRAQVRLDGKDLRAEKVQFLTPLASRNIVSRIHKPDETGEQSPDIVREEETVYNTAPKRPDGDIGIHLGGELAKIQFFTDAKDHGNAFEEVVKQVLQRHMPECTNSR